MIALNDILRELHPLSIQGVVERFISDIQYDSRKVQKDHAFIAIRGFQTDGHNYLNQAYQRGARVFFVEKNVALPDATVIVLKDTRRALAKISRVFFGHPDKSLKIIGITGTNGKTTTAYLLFSILESAHWNPGLISTVEYFDGTAWSPAERTTPESLDLFRLFYQMKKAGLKSSVMEVSSHALVLHRVEELKFVAGVFTNLGRDHLDFHHSMENYFLAKRRLFEGMNENQKVVLNLDDPYSRKIMAVTGGEVFTYSLKNKEATVFCEDYMAHPGSSFTRLRIPSGEISFTTNLLGEHNIYNQMAAVTTAVSLGLDETFIKQGLENMPRIPGRSEYFASPEGFAVYLDYAHTPDGIRKFLKAVWETRPVNLIVVFGAGGDRDRGKRPEMGKAAEGYADQIILTNDNPRSEDPETILTEILGGIVEQGKVTIVRNRREAIWESLRRAKKGDSVVIAGRGHERFQEFAGKRIPFEDRQVIGEFFRRKGWQFTGRQNEHS